MLCLLLFSVLVLGGAVTNANERLCSSRECGDNDALGTILPLVMGENELSDACPYLKEYFPCIHRLVAQCFDKTVEQLLIGDDEEKATFMQFFLDQKYLANDLCNPNTKFHTVFLRHASCFKKVHQAKLDECRENAEEVVRDYRELLKSSENKDELDKNNIPAYCLGGAHILACLQSEIEDECGQEARQTYQLIIKRSRAAEQILGCSEDHLNKVKTAFADDLSEDAEQPEHLISYFDIMMRK